VVTAGCEEPGWVNRSPHNRVRLASSNARHRSCHRRDGRRPCAAAGIVYLHYDRLEELHLGQAVPLELAIAVTTSHEIGHILLAKGHAIAGIMRPRFEEPEWHLARQEALGFTSHQSKALRQTLCRSTEP
jgi:hypothetical protein